MFILLFVFITSINYALDFDGSRQSLYGFQSFLLTIEVDSKLKDIGISEKTLQTDAELKLRFADIKIVNQRVNNTGVLYLSVNGFVAPNTLCIYVIKFEVWQGTYLERDREIYVFAPTWSDDTVGFAGESVWNTAIRSACKDQIDVFINAYLSVNPK